MDISIQLLDEGNYFITSFFCVVLSAMFIWVAWQSEKERRRTNQNGSLKHAIRKSLVIGLLFFCMAITKLLSVLFTFAGNFVPWGLFFLSIQPDLMFALLLYWWLADEQIVELRRREDHHRDDKEV